mmetsp:Transcript_11849/g.13041  ORF Transcript_11849/g.13041 Transcript_11849/m.13041 type:complete len:320 (-) Transcript_11849:186-1145(-)
MNFIIYPTGQKRAATTALAVAGLKRMKKAKTAVKTETQFIQPISAIVCKVNPNSWPILQPPTIHTDATLDTLLVDRTAHGVAQQTHPVAGDKGLPPLHSVHQIKLVRQPPLRTVYKRNLRPWPEVMLFSNGPRQNNLLVEAELIRCDTGQPLALCLQGDVVVKIEANRPAVFKKLKIVTTTQMQGTKFQLRFRLKRFHNTHVQDIPSTVTSAPIEVFSHVSYLKSCDTKGRIMPPKTLDIIPKHCSPKGGVKAIIMGSGFLKTARVKFGNQIIPSVYHESGALTIIVPRGIPHSVAKITVSNDGVTFSESYTGFYYTKA